MMGTGYFMALTSSYRLGQKRCMGERGETRDGLEASIKYQQRRSVLRFLIYLSFVLCMCTMLSTVSFGSNTSPCLASGNSLGFPSPDMSIACESVACCLVYKNVPKSSSVNTRVETKRRLNVTDHARVCLTHYQGNLVYVHRCEVGSMHP